MPELVTATERRLKVARRMFIASTFPVFSCFFLHACVILAASPRSSLVEEIAANLVALRYFVHGLFYIGTCGLYANTKGDFYCVLLALFYMNLLPSTAILIAHRGHDVLLEAYCSSLGVSALLFGRFVYVVYRSGAYLQNCIVEEGGAEEAAVAEVKSSWWLVVIQLCCLGEVIRSWAYNAALNSDREASWVINATIHTCVLPTLGLYSWKKLREETEESRNALCIYMFNLVLVLPQRALRFGLLPDLSASLGLALAAIQSLACVALLKRFDGSTLDVLELSTTDVVDFTDGRRATSFFDVKKNLIPCPRFHRSSVSMLGYSVLLFCFQWNVQGMMVSVLHARSKLSSELLFLGMNSGAHAAVMLGLLFFTITDQIAHQKPRLWFSSTANVGFVVLSLVSLSFSQTVWHAILMLVQGVTACVSAGALIGACADRVFTEPNYSVIESNGDERGMDEMDMRPIRRKVVAHLVAVVLAFSVLSAMIIGMVDEPLEARVESAGEYVFHFAFLLPLLAWTGLLVNHRFNLALAALACLFVLLPYCALDALVFHSSNQLVFVVVYFSIAVITGSLGYHLQLFRRYLIHRNIPQGHVVWGRK